MAQGFCVSIIFLVLYDVCDVYIPEGGSVTHTPSLPRHHLTIYSPLDLLTPFGVLHTRPYPLLLHLPCLFFCPAPSFFLQCYTHGAR